MIAHRMHMQTAADGADAASDCAAKITLASYTQHLCCTIYIYMAAVTESAVQVDTVTTSPRKCEMQYANISSVV